MEFFEFKNYKSLVLQKIKQMPRSGHGQFQRLASHIRVHSTMVSHIFKGDKHLTPDQAYGVCDFFGFNDLQTEYFLLLVDQERAAHHKLKNHYEKKLSELRKKAGNISDRLPQDYKFTEEDKSIFYSQWYYSGVRLLSAIPEFQTIDAIASYFGLPAKKTAMVIEFLLRTGLCRESNGKITFGPSRTHIESDSPLATRHHANWRIKCLERHDFMEPDELAFTSPVVIEAKDAIKVRKIILDFLENIDKTFEKSGSEELFCLNVDWVRVVGKI